MHARISTCAVLKRSQLQQIYLKRDESALCLSFRCCSYLYTNILIIPTFHSNALFLAFVVFISIPPFDIAALQLFVTIQNSTSSTTHKKNEKKKLVLVFYFDVSCPLCKKQTKLYQLIHQKLKLYKVALYKVFVLWRTCFQSKLNDTDRFFQKKLLTNRCFFLMIV